MNENEWWADRFEEHRAHLRAIAYHMLGSLTEADDAVQETWLRLSRSRASEIDNLGGWLTTTVARVCLNMLCAFDRPVEAFLTARVLAARPDATVADQLNLVRQLRTVGAPEAEINTALDVAMRLAGSDPVARQQVEGARIVSAISPERFPPQLAQLGFTAQILGGQEMILPPLCNVPTGPVRLGSDRRHDPHAWETELQRRDVMLPAFQIARFPVTVAEYACAVRAGVMRAPAVDSYSPISWPIQLARPDHPVVNISWHDAMAYAKWLAARTGQPWWRLPTEAEWEKAARFDPTSGTSERIYPWGDPFDRSRCNTSESRIGTTMPVGRYPAGESPSGARDMAGNVWEWTVCAYADDYSQVTIRSVTDALESRVRRGGSWRDTAWHARAGRRVDLHPHNISEDLGFRLVYALPQLIP